jgi:hypothetical protein
MRAHIEQLYSRLNIEIKSKMFLIKEVSRLKKICEKEQNISEISPTFQSPTKSFD